MKMWFLQVGKAMSKVSRKDQREPERKLEALYQTDEADQDNGKKPKGMQAVSSDI